MSRNNIWLTLLILTATSFLLTRPNEADANQQAKRTQSGRFALASTGESAVLLDTESGASWYLQVREGQRPEPIWIAIKRQVNGHERVGGQLAPQGLERNLLEAEMALEKLKEDFGNGHPQVRAKQREIKMIREELDR